MELHDDTSKKLRHDYVRSNSSIADLVVVAEKILSCDTFRFLFRMSSRLLVEETAVLYDSCMSMMKDLTFCFINTSAYTAG